MATQELINSISAASNVPTVELKEEERVALLAACTNLKSKLETPREATLQFLFASYLTSPFIVNFGHETGVA
ncbi:LOW QUALITY PROTEIN: hypothetical protein CIHG_03328 [Coccidioides immitis H538.4]|uniref:Uncharacterized protein n=1 Tax=Coccidioides immitis H538.4 TaxID=396776 RepID=A0A0J8RKY8_COCIT|nr:LOW QUALITY PROTEIN: hypothetical protein CIHG_03328 [Coccidioides immitis H538.4]